MKDWMNKGEHWIWFSASAVSVSVVLVFGLLAMIAFKGLLHFWAHDVYDYQVTLPNGQVEQVIGELHDTKLRLVEDENDSTIVHEVPEFLIKTGNRDVYGIDFKWINSRDVDQEQVKLADGITVIERYQWGNVYGHLESLKVDGKVIATGAAVKEILQDLAEQGTELHEEILHIEKVIIGGVNYQINALRLDQKKLELDGEYDAQTEAEFEAERAELNQAFVGHQADIQTLYDQANALGEVTLSISGGQAITVKIKQIVRFWQPNNMSLPAKVGFFFGSIGHFLTEDPREANTEGGVFPAIVGTVTMVLLMTILVTPMGVLAAIYMSEYAKEGVVLRLVRISINNLAGVPSIVFGIFGLGFFVYILGGSIDDLFYGYAAPNPVFGTPGLLWASLTMALLTLPVVIVSTQEGLSRIPRSLREGGLALGATKFETITRIVLPMATPAIMTGLILAIARAAGEVAPLMLVGVVKLAPTLPVDFNAPFIHLENKFMHLGFHIYDVGFQSPNVEASQPLVYATSLLLVVIIVSLNLGAIMIRNRLRERYKSLGN
ncbi:Phosphate transport system permease protein PstA (TC 3.A.1.7.1) [hydrothermal vent metagenome]|uniref:Phosphate transport system permease protein PstA (TC 3.A.1.7.1) n=1 Tax=hydrothermal vent metagenome TaxID=652676 RepID=A0A3B0W405_9ZZZZ